jgi:cell division protein FtsQ
MRLTKSSSKKRKKSFFPFLNFIKSFNPSSKNNGTKSRNKRARAQKNSYSFKVFAIIALTLGIAITAYNTSNSVVRIYNIGLDKFYQLTANIGLKVEDIYIEGRYHVNHDLLISVIKATRGTPIITYDIHTISNQLKKIDWIKSVVVQRRLPGVLYIKIQERQPVAIWKHQNNFYLVDTESIPIREKNLQPFAYLPIIVGVDAPAEAPKILAILKNFPSIYPHVTSLAHIRKRRWDLLISNHTSVKLPESNVEDALKRLSNFLESNKIPLENIMLVDLRMPKRIVIETNKATAIGLKIKGSEA